MTIALYKSGDTHTVRGIKCEIIRCEFLQMEDRLKEGYVKDPSELESTEEVTEVIEPVEEIKEVEKTYDPIRLKSKDAGIDGWETKRIKTLEGLLNGDKD